MQSQFVNICKFARTSPSRNCYRAFSDKKISRQEQIIKEVLDGDNQMVKLAAIDIDGIARGKYIHKSKLESAVKKGMSFCSVVFGWDSNDELYDNVKKVGWHMGYGDFDCKIDVNTFRRVPWEDNIPFFLMDFEESDGKQLSISPRNLLRKTLKEGEESGYKALVGFEYEWFNYLETPQSCKEKNYVKLTPLTPGMFGYSLIRAGQNNDFFKAITTLLPQYGIPIEGLHTETGPGVLEAAIVYSDALEGADRASLFKLAIKDIAFKFGILPTFMAKVSEKLPGCGGHMHVNLIDSVHNNNLFIDKNNEMTPLFEHFLAGQLYCLPHILPMYAPTINSYKRLVTGYWAPTKPTWAIENRTSSFRVIKGGKATRIEVRTPGADANPYLALSASIASGLYGIKHKLPLPPAVNGNAYDDASQLKLDTLPRNLGDASTMMKNSQISRALFGDDFVDHFTSTRDWEWRKYQNAVTDWETARYLEII